MAHVKIQRIIEHLDVDMKRALVDAAHRSFLGLPVDRSRLFKEFVRAVGRKCSTWERVPDRYVKAD